MKRIPVIPTILVASAVAAMIALGVWQLQRRAEKEVLLVRYARNVTLPPIAFPRIPIDDTVLFRRASAFCLKPVGFAIEGGRNARGGTGWRQIVQCRTGAEGPGFAVQLGFGKDPHAKLTWKGGEVRGYISHAPDHAPIVAGIFGGTPKTLMLVADPPLGGLDPNPGPDLSAVPNNHLAYAVQWFVFAVLAALIYAIALRRRTVAVPPAPR